MADHNLMKRAEDRHLTGIVQMSIILNDAYHQFDRHSNVTEIETSQAYS